MYSIWWELSKRKCVQPNRVFVELSSLQMSCVCLHTTNQRNENFGLWMIFTKYSKWFVQNVVEFLVNMAVSFNYLIHQFFPNTLTSKMPLKFPNVVNDSKNHSFVKITPLCRSVNNRNWCGCMHAYMQHLIRIMLIRTVIFGVKNSCAQSVLC